MNPKIYVGSQQSAAEGREAWFEDSVLQMWLVYGRCKADASFYSLKKGEGWQPSICAALKLDHYSFE